MSDDLRTFSKEEEERKRDAVMARDPLKRYQEFLEGIAWAEQNTPPEKRRNRPRLPHQK